MLLRAVSVLRIGFGVLAAVALGVQADRSASQGHSLVDFFSFFTIESNVLATVVLLWGGVAFFVGRRFVPDLLRGASVLYLAVTGLVYAVALAHLEDQLTLPWVNDVLHRVMPLVVVVDWLLVPPYRRLHLVETARWLAFPLLFLAYTLIRGPVVDWYPYPFLDPRPHGYGRVAVSCVLVTLAFLALTALLTWLGNVLGARRTGTPP
ncbi:Pr6Pr family membrane protein [Streptacidiphilus monticola]|uniref:Pr6Pr family membrane protein n=1 Tax=Streptacidiphilus monticola TaxID=2161674 RepID=A0ABW1G757_9ACTN